MDRLVTTQPFDDGHELVPTPTSQNVVVAQALLKSSSHLLKVTVTDEVAQLVVDRFEVIQIDEQDRQLFVVRLGIYQGGLQLLLQQKAIREPRQMVMVG